MRRELLNTASNVWEVCGIIGMGVSSFCYRADPACLSKVFVPHWLFDSTSLEQSDH